MEHGLAVFIDSIDIGAMFHQYAGYVGIPAETGDHQRCQTGSEHPGVNVGAGPEENSGAFRVPITGCEHQGGKPGV